MKRLLITGSRTWPDEDKVWFEIGRAVGELTKGGEKVTIIHGGASGVDAMADNIATTYGIAAEVYPADWRPHGIYNAQAGHQRNQRMIDLGFDMCLAFIHNNSAGATDCARRVAEAAIHNDDIHLRIFRS